MPRPHPVAAANASATTVTTLVALVVGFGIIPATTGDQLSNSLTIAIPALIALAGVVHTLISYFTAKKTTTPSSDPKAEVVQEDGSVALEPLVPASWTAVETFDEDSAGRHADQGADQGADPAPVVPEPEPAPVADTDLLTFDEPAATATA